MVAIHGGFVRPAVIQPTLNRRPLWKKENKVTAPCNPLR